MRRFRNAEIAIFKLIQVSNSELWIPSGDFQPRRFRPGGVGNWSGHLPFASDLVAAVQPKLLVELGTHYGESYFGFCQSVAAQGIGCSCYAVDTWLGEDQAGHYDEAVYQEVQAYNDAVYKSFSYLLRKTFDQAIENFADDSIDILHIDGLHTYDAVAHDFHAWLPKVKAGGVVLLHDVASRHGDFGVWKLWEELEDLGDRFLFTHSWGLGVFRKSTGLSAGPDDSLTTLFHSSAAYKDHVKKFYALCAVKLEYEFNQTNKMCHPPSGAVDVQIFPRIDGRYSLDHFCGASLYGGQWQKLRIELPNGMGDGPLRLDFLQQPGIVDVASVGIRKVIQDEMVWSVSGAEVSSLVAEADLSLVEVVPSQEFCRFVSTGNDPQAYLPWLDGQKYDAPIELETWIRVIVEPSALAAALKAQREIQASQAIQAVAPAPEPLPEPSDSGVEEAAPIVAIDDSALQKLKQDYDLLLASQEGAFLETERLKLSCRSLQGDLYVAKSDLQSAASSRAALERELAEVVHARNVEAERCRTLESKIADILGSRSWRVTAPLRGLKH